MINDQAARLRQKINEQNQPLKSAKTLAVVSGKGGVGKSNISLNLSLELANLGNKILLFDFDIGMGNVNILMGNTSSTDLSHFLYGYGELNSCIHSYTENISYVSAGNGFSELIEINDSMINRLLQGLEQLQRQYDYIIFDMGAGATQTVLQVLLAVDDIFVVTTPEPTAITDAYSMMKFISLKESESRFLLICNRAENYEQGLDSLKRLKITANKFLNKEVQIVGVLPEDRHVRQAVFEQTAFTLKFPKSNITQTFKKLVNAYLKESYKGENNENNESTFITKLRRFIKKGF